MPQDNSNNSSLQSSEEKKDMHETSAPPRNTFRKDIGDPSAEQLKQLRLMVLGCEPSPPYGPNEHTAAILLDLIGQAVERCNGKEQDHCWGITVTIFNVQLNEYPATTQEWDCYDGVLIPGSFSSAYDTDPWIEKLKVVIQERIVKERRPTLAICFGHQVLAHSFQDGEAAKVPTGPRAGRYTTELTPEGCYLLPVDTNKNADSIDLLFSHGDMVQSLPPTAVCLGGSSQVPVEVAAYFSSLAEVDSLRAASSGVGVTADAPFTPQPYAISFQAHPEYASSADLGLYRTFDSVLDAMEARGAIDPGHKVKARQDAHDSYQSIRTCSVDTMLRVGQLLGWFPSASQ